MKKQPARKAAVKKSPAVKKTVKKVVKARHSAAAAKPAGKAVKKAARKAAAPRKPSAPESLGRPLVTVEEKLYLLFKEDYHARQIFEFLRVETVGELEQFSPEQIIRILSAPVRQTVERIRERLKRALRDDADFARSYLQTHPPQPQ
jgi:hypothetical protein